MRFPSQRDGLCLSDLRNETPCEIKRDLLVEYLSTLERLKVVDWEHNQILPGGTADGVALRSAQRMEEIKLLRGAAGMKYSDHCRADGC